MKEIIRDYKVFLMYIFYSFVVFYPFLTGRQRVHDSYLVEIYGGYDYMISGLFNQGRVISSWFYQLLRVINPPYTLVMAVSVGASLVFLSIAAYIVFLLVREHNHQGDRTVHALAALGALMLFFNLFILETMLFYENAIMSLGILLAVVSAYFALRGGIKYYIISLICMIICVFCYQSTTAFFPPIVVLFLGANRSGSFWNKALDFIKKAIPAAAIYTISLLSNVVFLRLNPSADGRFDGEVRMVENLRHSVTSVIRFLRNNFGFMPDYLFSAFLLVFLAIVIWVLLRKKNYFAILTNLLAFALIFAATFIVLLPMSSGSWYILPRAAVAMAGIGGLMLVGISLHVQRIGRAVLPVAIIFVLLISQRQIDIQLNSHANNHLDRMELAIIGERLRDYEAYSGVTIEQIYFGYDSPIIWHRPQLNSYNDLTISMLHIRWMPRPFIWHYFGREVPVSPMTPDDMERIAKMREAHWTTGGRIVFDGGVVYLILNNITVP